MKDISKPKKYSGILVVHQDKCLLCKRNKLGTRPSEWSVPGGNIEKEETPIEAAYREFYEETNVNIDSEIQYIASLLRTNRDATKVKGKMFLFLFDSPIELTPDLINAKDGEEHTECKYFTKEMLPTPISNNLKKIIGMIL